MTRLRTAILFARLLARAARDIPDFLLGRMQEFVRHEQAKDTLQAVVGKKDAWYWLHATRGDAHTALELAQMGLDLETAVDWREQGFSPSSIRLMARSHLTTDARRPQ